MLGFARCRNRLKSRKTGLVAWQHAKRDRGTGEFAGKKSRTAGRPCPSPGEWCRGADPWRDRGRRV